MSIKEIVGKVFISESGIEYGCIRPLLGTIPQELKENDSYTVFAEDKCGNYFLIYCLAVFFWDHETSEISKLVNSYQDFVIGCTEPEDVELEEGQVITAWIDPDFASKFGVKS